MSSLGNVCEFKLSVVLYLHSEKVTNKESVPQTLSHDCSFLKDTAALGSFRGCNFVTCYFCPHTRIIKST